jgi:hypothetical protein
VLSALWTSVASAGKAVTAGVLVGAIDPQGTGARVIGVVPTLSHGRPGEPALDLTKWGWVHSAIDRYYAGGKAIGWYLSRPGHQAQLDETSLSLHRSYFPNGPSVLLLIDPRSGSAALHAGADGTLELVQRLRTDLAADAAPMAPVASGSAGAASVLVPVAAAAGVVAGVGLWLWAGLPGGTP